MIVRKSILFGIVLCAAVGMHSAVGGDVPEREETVYKQAYERLEAIKNQKKEQLVQYCGFIRKQVKAIASDPVLLDYFSIKNQYYRLQKESPPPSNAAKAIAEYKRNVLVHFAENFMQFYNALFVNKDGDVFSTIRKESDYHKNIFDREFSHYSFSSTIKSDPKELYFDFEYYEPSDEPAAFFVEPIYKEGEFLGWMMLQWAVNKLNFLMTDYENLGKTGEVFLVNKDQFLLTDIRFIGDSTILTKHLSAKNIELKFRERRGNVIVTDYRGYRALSAFEVFPFMGSEWLLIVKIDEDEILSEYFEGERARLQPEILERTAWNGENQIDSIPAKKSKKVDMDEYIKVDAPETLQTSGASTCTVAVACYPKRFAYMAHVSPMDSMYGQKSTDLLGLIVKRIKEYDIYKYERRNLEFHIVANHLKSIDRVVKMLLQDGFLLSQIHFYYNPNAAVEDVAFDCESNQCVVRWMKDRERNLMGIQKTAEESNLGYVLKECLQ